MGILPCSELLPLLFASLFSFLIFIRQTSLKMEEMKPQGFFVSDKGEVSLLPEKK